MNAKFNKLLSQIRESLEENEQEVVEQGDDYEDEKNVGLKAKEKAVGKAIPSPTAKAAKDSKKPFVNKTPVKMKEDAEEEDESDEVETAAEAETDTKVEAKADETKKDAEVKTESKVSTTGIPLDEYRTLAGIQSRRPDLSGK